MNKNYYKKIILTINDISIPLIVSSVSAVFMSIIDQAVIGRVSIDAYAGVGLVISCINSLVGVLGAISIAFNILGSKAKSHEDKKTLNIIFTSSILLNTFIGIFFYIIILLFCNSILNKGFGLNGNSLVEATRYIKIYALSILLSLLIFIYSTVFKIFRNTKNILRVTLTINIINVLLDYCLVFGKLGFPKLGAVGAALGTVIALTVNLIIYVIISKKLVTLNLKHKGVIKKSIEILKFSVSFIGQEIMEDMIFVFLINCIVARLGVMQLSAYTLLTQVISIILMPMFGYSTGNLSLVSEYYQKKKINMCLSVSKISCYILTIIFLILFSIVVMLNDFIPSIITSDKTLIEFTTKYLFIAVFIQIFNYILTIYKSSLQSIGYEKWTLKITSFINCICILFILLITKNLYEIYCVIGASYILCFTLFYFKYKKSLKNTRWI